MDPGESVNEEFGEDEMPQLDLLEKLSSIPRTLTEISETDNEEPEGDQVEGTEADAEDEPAEVEEEEPEGLDEETDHSNEKEEEVPQDEELGEEETDEGCEEDETAADLETEGHEEEEEEEEEEVEKPLEDVEMREEEEDADETDDGAGPPGAQETNNNNKEDLEQQEGTVLTRKRSASHSSADEGPKRKQGRSGSTSGSKHDEYCWSCHKDGVQVFCKICPRSYHFKCMHLPDEPPPKGQAAESTSKTCICPECAVVMNAENLETRSEAMKQLTVDQLITMLKNACQRMKSTPQAEPFLYPVDQEEAVDYFTYVVYPMDLTTLEKNVKQRQYGSTEAFLADAQWMVHNSIVFNSASSPFTATAKRILKTCKQEIQEIETCPECYVNAHHRPESWFIEACKRPHILVWAKLKGFPFWPAKAMKIKDEMVDVRFFGQHDRAWVCMKDCFLYSEEMPGSAPKRNNQLLAAIEELNAHIQKLKDCNGPFLFAAPKTPIGPELSLEQIRKMLPEFKPDGAAPKNISQVAKVDLQPKVKSPMVMRISSLKTNPTIVNSSVTEEQISTKPTLRIRKSKTTGSSNAESSSDESQQRKTDIETTVEKNDADKLQKKEEKESAPEEGSEILAGALGLSRMTRRSSRSDNASPASVASTDQSITNGEKRSTRSGQKTPRSSESGEETKEEPPPPDAFLQSIGLRKASDVKTVNSTSPTNNNAAGKLASQSGIKIKGEPEDLPDEELDDSSEEVSSRPGGVGVKTQELMNQISGNNKPGLRFNLSKDISISPVGEDSGSSKGEVRSRKPMIPGSNSARMPPGLIPQSIHMQMGGARPRPMGNVNGAMGGNQRLMAQRPLTRPLRPGGHLRPGMKINRPVTNQVQMRPQSGQKPKDPNSPIVVESSSLRIDGQTSYTTSTTGTVQMNQVQSMQGAITLPGGTITVTPLTPLIGVPITTYGSSADGNINGGHVVALKTNQTGLGLIQHNIAATTVTTANGLPISVISPHDGSQSQQHKTKPAAQQRRNLMNQIPPSVGHMVQNLQKSLLDMVKTTMENIVIEIVENGPASSGTTELKAVKQENEKLQKQIIDFKHNQEVSLREVKMGMENDKKRAVNELRRQFEHEKLKAVEETKKKQWCARCTREAQFYCCWNTSYCGYGCQEDHWPAHMSSCSQASGGPR